MVLECGDTAQKKEKYEELSSNRCACIHSRALSS